MSIDIGNPAVYGQAYYTHTNTTFINKTNPANASGKITLVAIYANSAMTGVEVATFYQVSTNVFSTRGNVAIGNIGAGYSQHAVNLDVQAGDYIGIYFVTGTIRLDHPHDGNWLLIGEDCIPCTNTTFVFSTTTTLSLSLYGTGYILITPSVVTNEVTGIRRVDPSKVNANGNITNDGSEGAEKVTTRGFKYGLTQADTWDIHEDGAWNEGTFLLEITGLDSDTIYYVRAYADNIKGRAFGSYVQFKTAAPYWANKIEIKAEATASDADIAKVGGKKTLTINNHLIQNMSIAQNIANTYLAEYKDQKIIMVFDRPIPLPYEISDTICTWPSEAILPYRLAAVAEIEYKLATEAEHYYKSLGRYSMIRKINLRFSAGNYISTLELER